jgi:hypothetical protein
MTMALGATTLCAASDHQGYAKVRYVEGPAVYSRAGGAAQAVERYIILHPGDTVKTDGKSHVDLALGYNNGNLHVTPNSELALDKLTYQNTGLEVVSDTQLNLKSGAIAGNVYKAAAGSKYEIKTPRGVAAIRGTRYCVWANGNVGITQGSGVMALTLPDGTVKTFTVDQGNILVAAGPQVRALTAEEQKDINNMVNDGMTHGGMAADEETRRFFFEAQFEEVISPTVPPQ